MTNENIGKTLVILRKALDFIGIIIVVMVTYLLLYGLLGNAKVIPYTLTVGIGESMGETMNARVTPLIVNEWTEYDEIEAGDIVKFSYRKEYTGRDKDIIVVHRVINKSPYGLVTKGDGNEHADGVYIDEDDYIGRVEFILKGFNLLDIRR